MWGELEECQRTLHGWGAANQLVFDAAKEILRVLHRTEPQGEASNLLGVHWDTKLQMDLQCREAAQCQLEAPKFIENFAVPRHRLW